MIYTINILVLIAIILIIPIYLKIRSKRKIEFGGNGKFECPKCKAALTFRDTITRVKCPHCQYYF